MSIMEFLSRFGFESNPFQSTNAADEPRLAEYFVPPPYFASVLGDPTKPKSNVVLAPRGGGKTAQRIMVEHQASVDDDFLCITYDSFDASGKTDSSLSFHLESITRLLLLAILAQISSSADSNQRASDKLTENDKQIIKHQIPSLLGKLSAGQFRYAIDCIKNRRDKLNDLWDEYGGKVAAILNAFIEKYGFGKIDPNDIQNLDRSDTDSIRFHFNSDVAILQKLGHNAIYILVDKVDEMSHTARDAKSTFDFISELLEDLPTLETNGVGFKFFLWDQVESFYRNSGARPDRIPVHKLDWSHEELQGMLSHRLSTYSNSNIKNLNQLTCGEFAIDAHAMVAYLAFGSPRDMIRICDQIISQQTRINTEAECVDEDSFWRAIKAFADERADELYGRAIPDLRKIDSATFTINGIANDVFRVSTQAARSKIQKWQSNGAIAKVGEVPNKGNRPLHLFGLIDPRLAIALKPGQDTSLVIGNVVFPCPSCSKLCVSDKPEISCHICSASFTLADCSSLLETCEIDKSLEGRTNKRSTS